MPLKDSRRFRGNHAHAPAVPRGGLRDDPYEAATEPAAEIPIEELQRLARGTVGFVELRTVDPHSSCAGGITDGKCHFPRLKNACRLAVFEFNHEAYECGDEAGQSAQPSPKSYFPQRDTHPACLAPRRDACPA